MTEFTPETARKLGYYVYALIDPRKKKSDLRRVFYVGKGVGSRCFDHAREKIGRRTADDEPNPKLELIRSIRASTGAPPLIEIICHGLTNADAGRVEAILIKMLRTDGNLVGGQSGNDYCLTVKEVEGMYANPLQESELGTIALLVSLNGGANLPPFPDIKEGELACRTMRYWRVSAKRAAQVDYVFGVYQQLVRCVFKTRKSTDGRTVFERFNCGPMKNDRPNWKVGFVGDRCPVKEAIWCNRRILNSRGETLTKFPRQQGTKLIGA